MKLAAQITETACQTVTNLLRCYHVVLRPTLYRVVNV